MRQAATIVLLLAVTCARAGEEPRAIIARAVNAVGGEANLTQARALQSKIRGTFYDRGVKESAIHGVKFTETLITQLPTQFKRSLALETVGQRLIVIDVLNGANS